MLLPIFCLSLLLSVSNVQAANFVVFQGMDTRYGGEVLIEARSRFSDQKNADTITEFVNTNQIGMQNSVLGYFWRPWFGDWRGNTNMRLVQRFLSGDIYSKSSTNSILFDTNWNAGLFRRSSFPFEVAFTYSRDDEEYYYQKNLVDRYSLDFIQSFTTEDNRTAMRGHLYFQGHDSDLSGSADEYGILGSLRHFYKKHDFNVDFEYIDRENNSDTDQSSYLTENQQLNIFGRHSYRPGKAFSMENFTSLLVDQEQTETRDRERILFQFNNNNRWLPIALPRVLITSNTRVTANERTFNGQTTDDQGINALAGAIYHYTPELRFDGSLTLDVRNNNVDTSFYTKQQVGASYSPESFDLYSFEYYWYAGSFVSNETSSNDFESEVYQTINGNIGQSFSKPVFSMMGRPVTIRINNYIDMTQTNQTFANSISILNNRASLNHAYSQEGLFTNSQIAVEDRREFGGKDYGIEERQTLSALLNGNYSFKRYTQWAAALNFELIRDQSYNGNGSTRYFSNGNVSYFNGRVMDVVNLTFRSTLNLSMDDVLSRNQVEKETAFYDDSITRTTWDNRLDYNIGRLTLRARLDISKNENNTNGIIMFEARRRFGYF